MMNIYGTILMVGMINANSVDETIFFLEFFRYLAGII